MSRPLGPSIRVQVIAALLVLVISTVAIITAVFMSAGYDQIEQNMEGQLEHSAAATARNVHLQMDAAERATKAVAVQITQDQLGHAEQDEHFGAAVLRSGVLGAGARAVYLVSTDEGQLAHRPPGEALPAPNIVKSVSVWFDDRTGHFVICEEAAGSSPGNRIYVVAYMHRSAMEGILAAGLEVLPHGSSVSLGIGKEWPYMVGRLAPGENLAFTAPVDRWPLEVKTEHDGSEMAAVQARFLTSSLRTSGLLILGVVFAGMLLAGVITRPVREVQSAVRKMASGDLQSRVRVVGAREIRALATDFNDMASTLEEDRSKLVRLTDGLEGLVMERTRELAVEHQKMEAFFYGVSHDIKSPVISIVTLLDMAMREEDPEKIREILQPIQGASTQLRSLISQLLEFAQAGSEVPKYEMVRLEEIMGQVRDEMLGILEGRPITITFGGRMAPFPCDPSWMHRILANLVVNAVHYMPDDREGRVHIRWYRRAGRITILVEDNGAGIADDVRKNIFVPFSRKRRDPNESGTGLGLSLVRRMVEKLGGTIEIPVTAMGTLVRIQLPSEVEE